MRFIQPRIFDLTVLQAAVSTRNGGVSTGVFSSLNMGKSTADDKDSVMENRRLFFSDLGIEESQTALSYQVHGTEILKAEAACRENGYDALITNKKGLFLIVSVADCTPVLLHDPYKHVVAAVHAGWRGTVHHILPKTIERMKLEYGCDTRDMKVYIGPCISFDYFEIGDEVAELFPEPFRRKSTVPGKYFADMKSMLSDQAKSSGISEKNIEISSLCTFCEESLFFSHRRDRGNTGRMVAVIGMK